MAEHSLIKDYQSLLNWSQSQISKNIISCDVVADTPYSYVLDLSTQTERYFVKQVIPKFYIEKEILIFLNIKSCKVPHLISYNDDLCCLLLKSCGEHTLRKFFDGKFNVNIYLKSIDEYVLIQKFTRNYNQDFLDMGLQDWRLYNLPKLYINLTKDHDFLEKIGFSKDSIASLITRYDLFCSLCHQLAVYNLPDVIGHNDLQDNNIIYNMQAKNSYIIDWSEATITHPLLSIKFAIMNGVYQGYYQPRSQLYTQIITECFSYWGLTVSQSIAIDRILDDIYSIYYVLVNRELIKAAGSDFSYKHKYLNDALYNFLRI